MASHIPAHLKSNRIPVYTTSSKTAASGDHADFPMFKPKPSIKNFAAYKNKIEAQEKNEYLLQPQQYSSAFVCPPLDPNVLSGYEEYVKEYCGLRVGQLRITPQSTLSLTLQHGVQVDVTVDGAVRVVNPKSHVAIAVNGIESESAFAHPVGRIIQDSTSVHLMAYDKMVGCHKFAKMWPAKTIFKSADMSFAYVMDAAGTRTTMNPFPTMPSNDITLPVFYANSNHGPFYKAAAESAYRVHRPPETCIRTSALTGTAGLMHNGLHCTASQGESSHIFTRFGDSKVHYNGVEFKLRTLSQAAGFDGNNRITLY
ncbi:hypothetical protein B566_EDAN003533 [Ephemera danica]|nr:hypothetical protein B566_EDAN003533 [Ephemera danica]